MKAGDRVRAVFMPQLRDDLRPGVKNYVNARGVFIAAWIIEAGEPYAGQWAMLAPGWWPCAWVPLCDLVEVEQLQGSAAPAHEVKP